jgi:hypothetical protein
VRSRSASGTGLDNYVLAYRTPDGIEHEVRCKPGKQVRDWEKYITSINATIVRRQWLSAVASR